MVGGGCAVGYSAGAPEGPLSWGRAGATHATRSSGVVFGCFQKRSQLREDGCRVTVL